MNKINRNMIRSDPKFDPDYFQINLGPSNHDSSDLLITICKPLILNVFLSV